jgi:TolB-like protein/Tfp pilus assembly protein PilF
MEPEAAGKVIGEKKVKPGQWKSVAIGLVVILIVVVAAVVIWKLYAPSAPQLEVASKEKMAFPLPDKPSIAVLPFVNMSGDPKEEYFCDGITDQIITSLSMIPRLFVIARNSTFVYKGKAIKVNKVAEEMGVRYVLEGSVQRSKDRVRILVQLIDAIKGVHLWSERYDRDLKDLFVLQDEIARQIMTALQVKLTEGEYASGVAGSTSNLKALECFWRAEERFFHWVKEDNAAARQWAQKAIELDPKFAGAWALMSWTHLMDVLFAWTPSPPQSTERALACAQKAIGLSDSCAKAYSAMGFINIIQRKFDEAVKNGEKAVRINPNDPIMLHILASIMLFNGKFDESIALTKNAMRLCPYYPAAFLNTLAYSCFLAGRYEEASAAGELMFARARKGEFSPFLAHLALVRAYIGLGQDQKAREHVEEVLKINPNYSLADLRKNNLYRNPAHLERQIEALRKAGLPEKPAATVSPSAEVAAKEKTPAPKSEKVSKPVAPQSHKEEIASKEKMAFPLPDVPSIAVMPFVNMSGDSKQDFLSDGITEEIITGLTKVRHLFVISRQSTFFYKGKPVKIKQVAEELGVRYVLEGSVQRSADRIRINAQLIDALTGRHIWAERYNRDLTDLFALQDEITMKILRAIQVKLTEGEQAFRAERYFKGKQGLDCYLKMLEVRKHYQSYNVEDTRVARRIAEEMVEMCPENPMTYVMLGFVHQNEYWLGIGKSSRESIEKGVELAQKALAMDDSLWSGHGLLSVFYALKREYEKSIAEAERAVALDPGGASVHNLYAISLNYACRWEDAIPMFQKALRLDPVGTTGLYLNFGNALRNTGRFEEAVSAYKKALQRAPDNIFAHINLAVAYIMMGREQDARAEAAEVIRINPKFSVDSYAKRLVSRDQSAIDNIVESLRKAGLK